MQKIVIEGTTVKYIREEIQREVEIDSFVANIEAQMGCDSGMLPRGCLYMKRSGERCVYLVEIPAGIAAVSFKRNSSQIENYMISIPFTQFYVLCNPQSTSINRIRVTVSKTPLLAVEQEVFVAPYLNIFNNGYGDVCVGNMVIPQNIPLNKKIDSVVSTFFEADFNADLEPSIPDCFKCKGRSGRRSEYIPEWNEFTKKYRFFAVSKAVEYKKHDLRPIDIIANLSDIGE